VVVVDLVTTGVKHEQASERTELEKPLKSSNGYFKSVHGKAYKGEPALGISSSR
jgi:hypothetical protein